MEYWFLLNNWMIWQTWIATMIFVLIAYLIGSLNFGQLLSRVKEVKLGEANSGNFGATNAGRTYGFKYFILVFIGDFSKVFVATAILLLFSTNILFFSHAALAFSLVFIIVGHMWPVYFNFKGGKGVATLIALMLIMNWFVALISMMVFIFVIFSTKRVSVAAISLSFTFALLITLAPLLTFVNQPSGELLYWGAFTTAWVGATLVTLKHSSNIIGIKNDSESKLNFIGEIEFGAKKVIKPDYSRKYTQPSKSRQVSVSKPNEKK